MRNLRDSGITTIWVPGKKHTYVRITEAKEGEVTVEFQNDAFKRKQFTLSFMDFIEKFGMHRFMEK